MGTSQKLQSFESFSTIGKVVVLDVAYLNRATFGDVPLRTEIISLFLTQMKGLAGRLEQPMDSRAWQFVTHTLKGAAATVGAQHLADKAAEWELRLTPISPEARLALATELNKAILDFERAAANLQ